ncbi:type I-E CRISPR-associated protein Cas5/CasD [Actinomyces sp. B33]|uniref:type I-E CRISPR-associated protein Cas5/CasD n=1 Tax=Actinomyces sp. B33 TaxID=2942131 RepID=UPI0023415492|nr:type I-E CRISPR-associated protein Cas5/CasD [Actinomyces sp. B33]MDC4232362.1 type I-E CRISPR-associated protein Cas5/CasD [Actinomyces sp. B33]
MSKVLILRLAGPMQSWGASSRFTQRTTEAFPTKSGIVGLLAAAQGRRRSDPIEDLAGLSLAARIDQPGQLLRDFHTAHREHTSMPLSHRFYLSDAVFTAFIEGQDRLIETLSEAIRNPVFPLFLGRRACPPTLPLLLDVRRESAWDALVGLPWQAARFHQRQHKAERTVSLRVVADTGMIPSAADPGRSIQDVPVSFDSARRLYGVRQVEETRILIDNPEFAGTPNTPVLGVTAHDPMEVI